MFEAIELPASISDLDTGLTNVDRDALPHDGSGLECVEQVDRRLKGEKHQNVYKDVAGGEGSFRSVVKMGGIYTKNMGTT